METAPTDWNDGEHQMHKLLHVPYQDNPTRPGLSAHAQRLLHLSSLLAVGVVDNDGRPWTTVLGGEPGFARSIGQSIIGVKGIADHKHDPVVQALLQGEKQKTLNDGSKAAKDFSALGLHLATRDRVKLQGKVLGTGVVETEQQSTSTTISEETAIKQVQMVFSISGSLGNCPKYLNKKDIILSVPSPTLLSNTLPLPQPALDLISKADLFFITSHHPSHMSTNDRGGPPGFIRVAKNDPSGTILIYPEYSGNRLYQTLGNLVLDPRVGIAIPDFTTGNILHISGLAKIILGPDAAQILPRSNLAVQILVKSARLIANGLSFRGIPGEPSPYNPPVRYLPAEREALSSLPSSSTTTTATATLLSRTLLTPTIARFRFSITDAASASKQRWTAGQYVALAFEDELSGGYAHMDDDDPRSLNDDYVRTFTVSSPPPGAVGALAHDEFEITIRNNGKVTAWLFRYNIRAGLEVPLRGFAGTFAVEQRPGGEGVVPFVAGGIGITPLLAQLGELDLKRLKLFWAVSVSDLGLVGDTLRRYPAMGPSIEVFVSGISGDVSKEVAAALEDIENMEVKVMRRRVSEGDIRGAAGLGDTWYVCAGPELRKRLLGWLSHKKVMYEDFNY